MKKIKKLLSILVAATMTLAMAAPTFADDPAPAGSEENTITITNATSGYTYNAYKILDATVPEGATDSAIVSYTATAEWADFLRTDDAAKDFLDVDEKGYVTVKSTDEDIVKAFAQAAKDVLDGKTVAGSVTPEGTATDLTATINVNGYGYYLVDSAVGTLCALNSNTPNVQFADKNEAPSVDKKVSDNAELTDKVNELSATIGQTLYFEVTVTAQPGAENYVLTDTMTTGLTFKEGSIKINNSEVSDDAIEASATGFTLTIPVRYYENITEATEIVVTYEATVNGEAITVDSSTNTASLAYGDPSSDTKYTPSSTTTITTHSFTLNKVVKRGNEITNEPLAGAEFKLYAVETDGDPIYVVATENGYRVSENADEEGRTDTIVAGSVTIDGLKAGTYYLEETKAPAGYNRIEGRTQVTVNAENSYIANVGNSAGSLLPSTGGIGTTIFYAAGIILMAGAVFFVVRRKRA